MICHCLRPETRHVPYFQTNQIIHWHAGTCQNQAVQVATLRPDALGCRRQWKHQSERPSIAPSRRSVVTQALVRMSMRCCLCSPSTVQLIAGSDNVCTLLQFGGRKKTKPATTVVPAPSYNIPLVLGGTTALLSALMILALCPFKAAPEAES